MKICLNDKMGNLAEEYLILNNRGNKESAFSIFIDKMSVAEKSIQEHGCYSEDKVEKELDKICRK